MGCSSSKSSPVSSSVLVLGATGNIGKATVYTLKKHHVNVTAGVRDPNGKEAQEFVKQGIKVLQVDMSSEEHALSEKLKGFESILINTPGHIDRAKITINAAKAAHKAGAKYVLVISVAVIDTDILFGKQFKEIEEEIKKLGILHGFLRLPMFIDNFYMQIETLTKQGVFYGPIDGDHQFVQVAVQDAANAAAQILSHYNEFKNQAFVITSDKKSYNECAKELSSALGKEVKYVCAGYEQARASFISLHVPEWQTDGILEIYKLVDKKDPCQTVLHNAFKEITGSNPTSFSEWAKLNAAAFGGDPEKGAHKKEGILVLGASGNIGAATVRVLAQKKAHVVAGVRDPTKNNVIELEKDGAKVVKADMSQSQAELAAILAHYKAVFIVVPGAENRAQLSINAIKAAKEAKVEYILVVSLPVAGHNEILFGKQFGEIEKEVHASGLNYGILKLPMFIDNTYGNAQPIIHQNAFYGPIDGHHKFQTVSCEDAGVAAAEILIHHDKHHAKTYTIVSDVQSYDEMAHSFSQALGREIKYVNAAYEGTKKALLEHHMPEWQVDGVLELYKLIEKAPPQNAEHHDFKAITGHEPTSNENWMKKHKDSFSAKAQ